MSQDRPAIPEAVKREVRQRCGFGCVICGIPIYHYDHIIEYSQVRDHSSDNIALLCPNHHQDKTSARLSETTLRKAIASPKNKFSSHTTPYRFFVDDQKTKFEVGGNKYFFRFGAAGPNYFRAIVIEGRTVLGISNEEGSLLLDLTLSDRYGEEVLRVDRGEMVVSTGIWDYKVEGSRFQIRSAPTKIDADFWLLKNGVCVDRGYFGSGKKGIIVMPEKYVVVPSGTTYSGCSGNQYLIGVMVG